MVAAFQMKAQRQALIIFRSYASENVTSELYVGFLGAKSVTPAGKKSKGKTLSFQIPGLSGYV
jgi:hypothetical protein